jgi:hypothetical protein
MCLDRTRHRETLVSIHVLFTSHPSRFLNSSRYAPFPNRSDKEPTPCLTSMARGSKYEEFSSASEEEEEPLNGVDGGSASCGGSSENTPANSDDAAEPPLEEADQEEIEAVARPADLEDEAGDEDDAEATQSTEDDAGDEEVRVLILPVDIWFDVQRRYAVPVRFCILEIFFFFILLWKVFCSWK